MNVHLEVQKTHPWKLINLIKVTSFGIWCLGECRCTSQHRYKCSNFCNPVQIPVQMTFNLPSNKCKFVPFGGGISCNFQFCVCLLENSLLTFVVWIPILNLCVHTSGHNDKDEKEPLTTVIPAEKHGLLHLYINLLLFSWHPFSCQWALFNPHSWCLQSHNVLICGNDTTYTEGSINLLQLTVWQIYSASPDTFWML